MSRQRWRTVGIGLLGLAAVVMLIGVLCRMNQAPAEEDPKAAFVAAVSELKDICAATEAAKTEMRQIREQLAAATKAKHAAQQTITTLEARLVPLEKESAWRNLAEARTFEKADRLRLQIGAEDAAYSELRRQADADASIEQMHRDRRQSAVVILCCLILLVLALMPMDPGERLRRP